MSRDKNTECIRIKMTNMGTIKKGRIKFNKEMYIKIMIVENVGPFLDQRDEIFIIKSRS